MIKQLLRNPATIQTQPGVDQNKILKYKWGEVWTTEKGKEKNFVAQIR